MKFLERLNFNGTLLRIPQSCEGCGESFACEIGLKGCWCLHVQVSDATREAIKAKHSRCLCRGCLDRAEVEYAAREPRV